MLQCVAALGFSSRVLVTTASTIASVILKGAPGLRLVGQAVRDDRGGNVSAIYPTVTTLTRTCCGDFLIIETLRRKPK